MNTIPEVYIIAADTKSFKMVAASYPSEVLHCLARCWNPKIAALEK